MSTSPAAPTDLFVALTPERVLDAVEAAGLRSNPVCYPLNSFENRVYEVELADRTRVVAKFYRPGRWSREQILEEHRFLDELEAAEIPVCAARRFPDGETVRQVDDIWYSVFDRRGGRAPDELDEPTARRLGRLAARMHAVGASAPARHRLHLGGDTFVRQDLAWVESQGLIPPRLAPRYVKVALGIADRYDALAAGAPTQRVHGDLHLGNLLFRDGLLRVLDFDDMVIGPPVQDLWLAIPGRDPYSLRLRAELLAGYEELRELDRSTLRLIEPLRGLRIVRFALWLARRWHDPIFPATWPDFGTPEWWERETDELERQLAVIDGEVAAAEEAAGGPPRPASEEAPELTNKDYFWDWEG